MPNQIIYLYARINPTSPPRLAALPSSGQNGDAQNDNIWAIKIHHASGFLRCMNRLM